MIAMHEIRNLLQGLSLSLDLINDSNEKEKFIKNAKNNYGKLYIAFENLMEIIYPSIPNDMTICLDDLEIDIDITNTTKGLLVNSKLNKILLSILNVVGRDVKMIMKRNNNDIMLQIWIEGIKNKTDLTLLKDNMKDDGYNPSLNLYYVKKELEAISGGSAVVNHTTHQEILLMIPILGEKND